MGSNGKLWAELSSQWSTTLKRPNNDLILRLWTSLEAEPLALGSLSYLDSVQVCEKFLWPTFDKDSPNQHVVLLCLFIHHKQETRLLNWSNFLSDADRFSHFFHRVLSLSLDSSINTSSRVITLNFVSTAFRSLEQDDIRKLCAPLVSIGTWENLHDEAFREAQLDLTPGRRKAWRAAKRRFDSADQEAKLRMRIERAWLYNMVLDFLKRINQEVTSRAENTYCAQFLEFLTDLISQLPTRRYSIVLLKDLCVLPLFHLSLAYHKRENHLLRDLASLYEQFAGFQIDDVGEIVASKAAAHKQSLAELQKIALQHFDPELKVLALSNFASISQPHDLKLHFEMLSDLQLERLCSMAGLRTSFPASAAIMVDRKYFIASLLAVYTHTPDLGEVMQQISAMPTDQSLYDETLLRNEVYKDAEPLALPKFNLQYLTLNDFLWRSFKLQQAEVFYEIRKDLESIVRKMKARKSSQTGVIHFDGFSRMAIPIDKPAIIDVSPPVVGDDVPAHIRVEVVLDVSRLGDKIRPQWEALRPKDTVFLLAVQPLDGTDQHMTNGSTSETSEQHGIRFIRTAEVVQLQDEKGKPLKKDESVNGYVPRGRTRRLLLDLDPRAFSKDKEQLANGKSDIYKSINVIARRSGRENNFRPILESIQSLAVSDTRLPAWLQEVYLGYGQPAGATYPHMDEKFTKLDYLDTFLDWEHLQESFRPMPLQSDGTLSPPYVLNFGQHTSVSQPANPKKRRFEQMEDGAPNEAAIEVSSYKPLNTGPYPIDVPKRNHIRFTPKQVQALVSGTQPGISLIVGPPGTGKTDVATQIINVLYHNFPEERILLVAHSNQALNQLFQKIVALDIDQRHLLRLGHGEEDLDTEGSFSRYGRVEFFMENRQSLLSEVNRLAHSIGAQGVHGSSCETAEYFNQVFIQPAISRFQLQTSSSDTTKNELIQAFPFKQYFSNAPIPDLFPLESSVADYKEIANGCFRHINTIFTSLSSIRPFEVLRSSRDQANHLLLTEARIIAMTTTHAAIRRSEIANLGFRYDTLIMEEAAQVTEIESFIPMALQNPSPHTGELSLKRIVLIGDHLQNSPIIQNFALRDYANLDQSLFLRLIRLGVPAIMLDAQGRCRPSITQLFSWRYPGLQNLPHITLLPDFQRANAGFRHEFQFINIDDYHGGGEREPSPHFIQNLGEAEYAVALYQYMRLLGYPAKSISILAAYAGQKALISDVLEHRCKGNRLFGLPRIVTTIDKYQGEQNDYIILSLTRTKAVGYLRDVRRLTVALSRARLGLYVLGRKALFETCQEMEIAMQRLNVTGNADGHLEVVTGEMFPTQRGVDDNDVASTEIHGVEHLGQYVYEMTQAMVKKLGGNAVLETSNGDARRDEDDDGGLLVEAEVDAEVDPLHENVGE